MVADDRGSRPPGVPSSVACAQARRGDASHYSPPGFCTLSIDFARRMAQVAWPWRKPTRTKDRIMFNKIA